MIDWLIFLVALSVLIASVFTRTKTMMGKFISVLAVMIGTSFVVTGTLRLVPGDPIDHILGEQALASSRDLLAKELGLMNEKGEKLSFVEAYGYFIRSLSTNELKSYITRRPALTIISERLPYTLALAFCVMLVAILFGPLFGIIAAVFYQRWPDHLLSIFALLAISIPSFFLGPLLLLAFAIDWQVLPVSGADNGVFSLILPSLAMGLAMAAMLARLSRASMLEVLSEDYVRTAHAKGLSPFKVIFKHALRNALIPVSTIAALQFGAILAGSVITEKVFNWPGIGLLLLEAIQQLDMPLVQVTVLIIAFIYAFINLCTDILYKILDPRVHMEQEA